MASRRTSTSTSTWCAACSATAKLDAAKLPGTRWVKLRDIYETCGVGAATSALEAFGASLVEEMKTARENVVEEIYDGVEEESEVEDDATLGAAG